MSRPERPTADAGVGDGPLAPLLAAGDDDTGPTIETHHEPHQTLVAIHGPAGDVQGVLAVGPTADTANVEALLRDALAELTQRNGGER